MSATFARFGICTVHAWLAVLPDIPFDYLEENTQRLLLPK